MVRHSMSIVPDAADETVKVPGEVNVRASYSRCGHRVWRPGKDDSSYPAKG